MVGSGYDKVTDLTSQLSAEALHYIERLKRANEVCEKLGMPAGFTVLFSKDNIDGNNYDSRKTVLSSLEKAAEKFYTEKGRREEKFLIRKSRLEPKTTKHLFDNGEHGYNGGATNTGKTIVLCKEMKICHQA